MIMQICFDLDHIRDDDHDSDMFCMSCFARGLGLSGEVKFT